MDTDEPPVLLGENRAPNAGEYVLQALAACLTGTIAYHAAARGIALDGLETTIHGDLDLRGFLDLDGDIRPGYEEIRVTIKATGDFDDYQLAELASLTRYSPVRDIVSNPVPVAIDLARLSDSCFGPGALIDRPGITGRFARDQLLLSAETFGHAVVGGTQLTVTKMLNLCNRWPSGQILRA